MFRGSWYSPRFWRWWWQYRASVAARSLVIGVAVALLAGGGYALATSLSQPAQSVTRVVTTVEKVKYVRAGAADAAADAPLTPPDLRQLVPVQIVRTRHDTTVVTVPVVHTLTVTTRLPSQTVVRTRVAAAPAAKTLTHTVTRERTRTKTVVAHETQTVTNEQSVVSTLVNVDTVTVTVSQPVTATVTRTTTQPVAAATVTRTTTQPVTTSVTVTATQPVTTTISQPTTVTTTRTLTTTVTVSATVTVTQPSPPPPGRGKP